MTKDEQTELCPRCDDTGLKDYAAFAKEPCDNPDCRFGRANLAMVGKRVAGKINKWVGDTLVRARTPTPSPDVWTQEEIDAAKEWGRATAAAIKTDPPSPVSVEQVARIKEALILNLNKQSVAAAVNINFQSLADAALSALSIEDEWQPIESAPKDGTPFLAYCIERPPFAPAPTYSIQIAKWGISCFMSTTGAVPTHWRPLPPPPEGAG